MTKNLHILYIVYVFLFAKDHRTMTSEWQGALYFQETRPGAGFKTGDFVKKN